MADISMPEISSLYKHITADFPELTFGEEAADFRWIPSESVIIHPPISSPAELYQLLHEIGHAMLHHQAYQTDVSLITMEREAWSYAVDMLAPRYDLPLTMSDPIIEQSLDSYRSWLHARSSCPRCSAIGIEQSPSHYRCLSCQQTWRVNEARTCGLKRYTH